MIRSVMTFHGILAVMALTAVPALTRAECGDKGPAIATSNFVISYDGKEAYDRRTNITWQRCPLGMNISPSGHACIGQATQFPLDVNPRYYAITPAIEGVEFRAPVINGLSAGWKIPGKNQLASLIDPNCANPAINTEVFPSTPVDDAFWSVDKASHNSHGHDFYYLIGFGGGSSQTSHEAYVKHYMRLYMPGQSPVMQYTLRQQQTASGKK